MAKRFIDTKLFYDSWFMNLSVEAKLFYVYLFTNCDHAGIIDLNIRLAEFQTGIKELANTYQTLTKQFGEKRFIPLGDNYYFLPKFILFQYSKGLSINVKAQKSVIDRLGEFNINIKTLNKELGNSYTTVQDKDKYKDRDKDKDLDIKGGVGEKINFDAVYNTQWFESISRNSKLSIEQLTEYWEQFKKEMVNRDDLYRDPADYKKHFANWFKINNQTNTDSGFIKRRNLFADTGLIKAKGILNEVDREKGLID